jgi:prepilin-type N-terminal cleavage/methylation domain-containing protein
VKNREAQKVEILNCELQSPSCTHHTLPITHYWFSKGFTLIELTIVVAIIGLMLSVALPVSYNMYLSYQNSLEAQKVLTVISALRREAFLYSEERFVDAKDGLLVVNGKPSEAFRGMSIAGDGPITFYRNGTTSGGNLRIRFKDELFTIKVVGPTGDLRLLHGEDKG